LPLVWRKAPCGYGPAMTIFLLIVIVALVAALFLVTARSRRRFSGSRGAVSGKWNRRL